MNKYKRLFSNTLILAIGTFSSKVLVFLLMPYYTRVLSTEELGTGDLITSTANLLIPLMSLAIVNSIIRFGLDKAYRKDDVLSTGLIVVACGYVIVLPFAPLVNRIGGIGGHAWLIYLFMLTSILRSLFSQFVRARGQVKLYSLDGILSTVMTILFNILFLTVFHMGVEGYVLATICADACSSVFLFFVAGLRRFIKFQYINKKTAVSMVKYAVPLIPNMLCWWITNSSDKYIINYYLGAGENGLLTAAYKLPTIVSLVATIFLDAWQMSAITEKKDREEFFTKVFRSFGSVVFLIASGLILTCQWIMTFFVGEEFYSAWRYIPFLVMATSFSCLVNFLGSVYTIEKKSTLSMLTMIAGAGVNLVLNFILTPLWGVNGATLATFIGYFVAFLLRAVSVQRYIRFRMGVVRLAVNTVAIGAQSVLLIFQEHIPGWIWYEIGIFAVVLLLNAAPLLDSVRKLLRRGK